MGAENDGLNPDLEFSEADVLTDAIGGHQYILNGDIRYPLPKNSPIDLNYAADYGAKRWRNGVVNIGFDPGLNETQRDAVRAAFRLWEPAGITITEGGDGDIAIFVNSTRNESYPGRLGGPQSVWIESWQSRRTIAHEIGHLLGLEHEQQRPDRDAHIDVNTSTLRPVWVSQYAINRSARTKTTYDLGSIMHYPQKLDARDYTDGIVVPIFTVLNAAEAPGHRIGEAQRPSARDIAGVRAMYATQIA